MKFDILKFEIKTGPIDTEDLWKTYGHYSAEIGFALYLTALSDICNQFNRSRVIYDTHGTRTCSFQRWFN